VLALSKALLVVVQANALLFGVWTSSSNGRFSANHITCFSYGATGPAEFT
jgi:hypothetical protein